MAGKISAHVRSNAYGLIAIFIALSGTTYAAVTLEKNQVRSKHIGKGQVKNPDLADNSVTSPKVADGSLLSEDFGRGQLPQGEQGPQGPLGPQGEQGPQGLPGEDGSPDTPQQVLDKLKQKDGNGSGLDADLVDGQGGATFIDAGLPGDYCSEPRWMQSDPEDPIKVSYYRDPFGMVHLRGEAVKCGAISGVTAGDIIFTLPPGFRPQHYGTAQYTVGQTSAGPNFAAVVRVSQSGYVYTQVSEWDSVGLDGVVFRCWPSGVDGCP